MADEIPIPDMGQIVRMIPGMMVTVAGGAVMSALPGKIKIVGLPIVGYGMWMMLGEFIPMKAIDITPWTSADVNLGEAFDITTRLTNTGNVGIDYSFVLDITNPLGSWFRTYSGTGFLGAQWANNTIDITSVVDAGWDGPDGVYIGKARVFDTSTDPPTLLDEYEGSIFTVGEAPPEKKVYITPWTPANVNVGDAVDITITITNTGSEAISYNSILDITDSSGNWFKSFSGSGFINVGQTINISSPIDAGWTGPEGIYNGHMRVFDATTDPTTLVGEHSNPIMVVGIAPPERMIYGYVFDGTGSPIGGAGVSIDEYPIIGDTTGPDGYYELKGLPETSEVVHVTASALARPSQTQLVGLPGPEGQVRVDFTLVAEVVSVSIGGFDVNGV